MDWKIWILTCLLQLDFLTQYTTNYNIHTKHTKYYTKLSKLKEIIKNMCVIHNFSTTFPFLVFRIEENHE